MKKITVIILVGMILMINVSFQYLPVKPGNTVSNYQNYGFATTDGENIYYAILEDTNQYNAKIIKIDKDGNEEIILDASKVKYGYEMGTIHSLSIVSDKIYFTNRDNHLYSLRTDGSEYTEITTEFHDYYGSLTIYGDSIYFCRSEGIGLHNYPEGYIYKKTINDGKEMLLERSYCTLLGIDRGWIYYRILEGDTVSGYYRMKLDGTNKTKLKISNKSKQITVLTIDEDWIYYYYPEDKFNLFKMKPDGSRITQIIKSKAVFQDQRNTINVSNGWIYYRNYAKNGHLYKVKTNGTNNTLISAEGVRYLNVVGEWIFYMSADITYYKIKTDGTHKTKLNGVIL